MKPEQPGDLPPGARPGATGRLEVDPVRHAKHLKVLVWINALKDTIAIARHIDVVPADRVALLEELGAALQVMLEDELRAEIETERVLAGFRPTFPGRQDGGRGLG